MTLLSRAKTAIRAALDRQTARRAPGLWEARKHALVVLSYHRVLPRDFPELAIVEPGMYVHDDTFSMHLDVLQDLFTVVDLADYLKARARGDRLPDRAVAISFDDGWRDNYEYAYPQLRSRELPATIFVVSAMAGTSQSFWPERLARILSRKDIDIVANASDWLSELMVSAGVGTAEQWNAERISKAIGFAKRESDETINSRLDDIEANIAVSKRRDLADWDELGDMASTGLVRLGSHTRRHTRMREGLTEKQLRSEIVGSKEDIFSNTSTMPRLFCYPNGDTTEAARAVVAANYLGACTTAMGWNAPESDAHSLSRIMLHEDRTSTRESFIARLHQGFCQKRSSHGMDSA